MRVSLAVGLAVLCGCKEAPRELPATTIMAFDAPDPNYRPVDAAPPADVAPPPPMLTMTGAPPAKEVIGANRPIMATKLRLVGRDRFAIGEGAVLDVQFEGDRPVRTIMTADADHASDEEVLRKWLGTPKDGTYRIAGRKWRVTYAAGGALDVEDLAWLAEQRKIEEARERTAKKAAVAESKREAEAHQRKRANYAEMLEERFLGQGQDVTVRARGSTMWFKWILCNRATVYQIANSDAGAVMRDLGMTKIDCSDGYGGGATIGL